MTKTTGSRIVAPKASVAAHNPTERAIAPSIETQLELRTIQYKVTQIATQMQALQSQQNQLMAILNQRVRETTTAAGLDPTKFTINMESLTFVIPATMRATPGIPATPETKAGRSAEAQKEA